MNNTNTHVENNWYIWIIIFIFFIIPIIHSSNLLTHETLISFVLVVCFVPFVSEL